MLIQFIFHSNKNYRSWPASMIVYRYNDLFLQSNLWLCSLGASELFIARLNKATSSSRHELQVRFLACY